MSGSGGTERVVAQMRAAYTWVLVRSVSQGSWVVALAFLVLATVVNAARGDWLSVVVGSVLAAEAGRRLWSLRDDGPAPGQARTASK